MISCIRQFDISLAKLQNEEETIRSMTVSASHRGKRIAALIERLCPASFVAAPTLCEFNLWVRRLYGHYALLTPFKSELTYLNLLHHFILFSFFRFSFNLI